MNLECPRCGKSPWHWSLPDEDYCTCGEEVEGESIFLPPPPNYIQHQSIKDKDNGTNDKFKTI